MKKGVWGIGAIMGLILGSVSLALAQDAGSISGKITLAAIDLESGTLAVTGFPVERPDLSLDASGPRAVRGRHHLLS